MARSPLGSREYYHRHLPHQVPKGVPLFVTWNLKGSLPQAAWTELEYERARLDREPYRAGESREERKRRIDKMLFVRRDHVLDMATSGPLWLKDGIAAQIVVDRILSGARTSGFSLTGSQDNPSPEPDAGKVSLKPAVRGEQRYELFAHCVMANHVHVLLKPKWELKDLMQGIKGFTSFRINRLQNARGRTFWQDESYDHWCREEQEFFRIIEYIERNPVAAGLCASPEDWPWSSARWRPAWKLGVAFRLEFLPADDQQRLLAAWQSK